MCKPMPSLRPARSALAVLLLGAATARAYQLEAYAKAANAESDYYGRSVSLSGDTLVVGAPYEGSCSTSVATTTSNDNSCSKAGAVHVYVRNGTTWSFQACMPICGSNPGL